MIQKRLHFQQCVLVVKLGNVLVAVFAPAPAKMELVIALVLHRFASVILFATVLAAMANANVNVNAKARILRRAAVAQKVYVLNLQQQQLLVESAHVIRVVGARMVANVSRVGHVLVVIKSIFSQTYLSHWIVVLV
jgi:hypothetical protein